MMSSYLIPLLSIFLILSELAYGQRLMTSCTSSINIEQKQIWTIPLLLNHQHKTATYPTSSIHQTDTQYFLVLSGYEVAFNAISCYHVYITSANSTQIEVTLTCICGNRVGNAIFYIVAINPSNYVWISTFATYP